MNVPSTLGRLVIALLIATPVVLAASPRSKTTPPQMVTLTGRIVDLQCHMSEQYPSADKAKCTRTCILSGVPAALETPAGLVILGTGMQDPKGKLVDHAFQDVEVKGKLYDKQGLKYLDLTSIKPHKAAVKEDRGEDRDPDHDADEDEYESSDPDEYEDEDEEPEDD